MEGAPSAVHKAEGADWQLVAAASAGVKRNRLALETAGSRQLHITKHFQTDNFPCLGEGGSEALSCSPWRPSPRAMTMWEDLSKPTPPLLLPLTSAPAPEPQGGHALTLMAACFCAQ